jgi:lysozyme family protein
MVAATYGEALRRLLMHEGGYGNHPSDPGGPTNFGITIADYAAFKGRAVTAADVRAMPLADAKAIYRVKYWSALLCDALPAGLDYALFDYGVNSGTARAAKVLQRLLGLTDDGRMTRAVVSAAQAHDPADLIARLCDERLAFLKRLATWPVFGAGWGRRVAEVRAAALAMAKGTKTRPSGKAATPGKGAVPLNTGAQQTTAGVIVAGGAAAAHEAHQWGAGPAVMASLVMATLALAALGWLFWRRRQKRKQEQ